MKLGLRNLRPLNRDWQAQFDAAAALSCEFLQIDGVNPDEMPILRRHMERTGIKIQSITALTLFLLGPDQDRARQEQEKTRQAVDKAAQLGAPCVTVFAGYNATLDMDANFERFAEVFTPLAEHAHAAGVKLVLENCPMPGGTPLHARNLAYCPAHWRRIFELVPSPGLGLELDCGHLPGLGIDAAQCVRDFASHLGHIGLKDAKVDHDAIQQHGWISPAIARHVTPGEGDTNWPEVFKALHEVGYHGVCTLDHVHPPTDTVERYRPAVKMLMPLLKSASEAFPRRPSGSVGV